MPGVEKQETRCPSYIEKKWEYFLYIKANKEDRRFRIKSREYIEPDKEIIFCSYAVPHILIIIECGKIRKIYRTQEGKK